MNHTLRVSLISIDYKRNQDLVRCRQLHCRWIPSFGILQSKVINTRKVHYLGPTSKTEWAQGIWYPPPHKVTGNRINRLGFRIILYWVEKERPRQGMLLCRKLLLMTIIRLNQRLCLKDRSKICAGRRREGANSLSSLWNAGYCI